METPHPVPALHFAAMTGNLELIGAQLLLGANVNQVNHHDTPLLIKLVGRNASLAYLR
jgi:uncharacterized membrane protein YoaK (UPF0700 family)